MERIALSKFSYTRKHEFCLVYIMNTAASGHSLWSNIILKRLDIRYYIGYYTFTNPVYCYTVTRINTCKYLTCENVQ